MPILVEGIRSILTPVIPAYWNWKALETICEVILGQSPPSKTYNEEGKGLPFYQGKTDFGFRNPSPRKWCTIPKKTAEKDDILVSVRAPVGPVNISPEKVCIGRGLAALRCSDQVDSEYLYQYMRKIEHELAGMGAGSTFKAITGKQLRSLKVPVPPIYEQRSIGRILKNASLKVESTKRELARVPDMTRRLRMAILSKAFRGELTRRKTTDEPASILLQESPRSNRIEQKEGNQKSAMRLQKWEIPGSWIWTNLDTISILERGRFSHRPRNEPRFYGGSYPFIQTGDISRSGGRITSYVQTLNEDGLAISKMFKGGTVLVAIAANIADSAILAFDACATDSVVGITPYEGVTTPEYIEFFMRLRKEEIEMFAPATAQKNINLRILRAVEIPLAPLNEQHRIAEKIRAYLDSMNELDDYSIRALKHLENLDRSMLSKAFRGDLFTQEFMDSKSVRNAKKEPQTTNTQTKLTECD